MFDRGMIYRGHKPVHWCKHCHTALAEAEIEYGDETSPSIYVRFELTSKPAGLESFDGPVDFVIWTTTPWTIPRPTRRSPSSPRRSTPPSSTTAAPRSC